MLYRKNLIFPKMNTAVVSHLKTELLLLKENILHLVLATLPQSQKLVAAIYSIYFLVVDWSESRKRGL